MAQDDANLRQRIIDAALGLAAVQGWRDLSLAQIAKAADLPLADVYAVFHSKQAILEGYLASVDDAVLRSGEPDLTAGTAHDRLFDAVMRRLERLEPHRAAVHAILDDTSRDPMAVLCGMGRFLRSMAATLEAAGIPSDGVSGLLRAQGLGMVYLQTMRVWLNDETPDKARTMAALDRNLRRAEGLCRFGRRRRGRRRPPPADTPLAPEEQPVA